VHSNVTILDCVHYMEQTTRVQFISTNHIAKLSLGQYRIALHTDISVPTDCQCRSTRLVANSKHVTQPDLKFVEGL